MVAGVRHSEFFKTVSKVEDVCYGDQKMIDTLFMYKLKEEKDHIDL